MSMTRPLHSTSITPASSLLRGSPPLSGASVLSASRLEPLVPFPLASPVRFSRSVQVDHRHCRPAADETGPRRQGSFFLACRNLVPTFPQRSPPSLLTTAACGGLRSAPDCRPRRTSLHLSYSCATPFGPAILMTQDPSRTW